MMPTATGDVDHRARSQDSVERHTASRGIACDAHLLGPRQDVDEGIDCVYVPPVRADLFSLLGHAAMLGQASRVQIDAASDPKLLHQAPPGVAQRREPVHRLDCQRHTRLHVVGNPGACGGPILWFPLPLVEHILRAPERIQGCWHGQRAHGLVRQLLEDGAIVEDKLGPIHAFQCLHPLGATGTRPSVRALLSQQRPQLL
mmetsp:Transcript_30625/g.61668  ORF Transcript_30625/g.61668 Transcript_30625/m.61668 type:complete len:201 (+) Transcript_30625:293-895(+)